MWSLFEICSITIRRNLVNQLRHQKFMESWAPTLAHFFMILSIYFVCVWRWIGLLKCRYTILVHVCMWQNDMHFLFFHCNKLNHCLQHTSFCLLLSVFNLDVQLCTIQVKIMPHAILLRKNTRRQPIELFFFVCVLKRNECAKCDRDIMIEILMYQRLSHVGHLFKLIYKTFR